MPVLSSTCVVLHHGQVVSMLRYLPSLLFLLPPSPSPSPYLSISLHQGSDLTHRSKVDSASMAEGSSAPHMSPWLTALHSPPPSALSLPSCALLGCGAHRWKEHSHLRWRLCLPRIYLPFFLLPATQLLERKKKLSSKLCLPH